MIPNTNRSDDDRGQVGIGTLIIFIALVLVAAVAAGVLVNTAGLLQSQAEETGQDAQSQVGNQIDVVSATGEVEAGFDEDDNIDEGPAVDGANLVVKKSAGSDPIDLEDATIQYTSGDTSTTLTYDSDAGEDTFAVEDLDETEETVMTSNGDRLVVSISLNEIENDDNAGTGLEAGSSATLRIVDQSGATTTYVLNPPSVLPQPDDDSDTRYVDL